MRYYLVIIALVVFMNEKNFAQSSFGLTGLSAAVLQIGYESNPSNYYILRDWGLNVIAGTEFSETASSGIYSISLFKQLDTHLLSARYTPGFQKDFIFRSGQSVILGDSSIQTLDSRFTFKETFGLGYSYKFNRNFSAGFTLRNFTEEFNRETVRTVFADTITLVRDNIVSSGNIWRSDIGIDYLISDELSATISTINLVNFGEFITSGEDKKYQLRRNRGLMFRADYSPFKPLAVSCLYETDGSFQAGITGKLNTVGSNFLNIGLTAFHDNFQQPFFAGIIPVISYSINNFTFSLSGVKYFSDRKSRQTISEFRNTGVHNIINNRYSFDKALLSVTLTLNTVRERLVEFVDLEITLPMFPAFTDFYQFHPFAIGKVINISDKVVMVKPFAKINGINDERIQSPELLINPGETATVNFYTIIPDAFIKDKAEISFADFYLLTGSQEPDDVIQKPVLVHSSNAWDGNVTNLRYFIKRNLNFSIVYAKNLLSAYKENLDTTIASLLPFQKVKFVFNEVVKNLVYVSDPRASAEYVQYPEETLILKGGDCDDLSVLFSSLFLSVGIETALVDFRFDDRIRHVNLLINTGLTPDNSSLITDNDKKYFVRKNEYGNDEVWIALETTSLSDFETAWNAGSKLFHNEAVLGLGLAKGLINIVDVY